MLHTSPSPLGPLHEAEDVQSQRAEEEEQGLNGKLEFESPTSNNAQWLITWF
jgi:hypothetical protein